MSDLHVKYASIFWLPLDRIKAILGTAAAMGAALNLAPLAGRREIELPGMSAPHGPQTGGAGEQRPQWTAPVEWVGVPPD